jgi:hypothetical protein
LYLKIKLSNFSKNENRPSSLLTNERNTTDDLSDMESPMRLIINNNTHQNDKSIPNQLSTSESKSLINLANSEKKAN